MSRTIKDKPTELLYGEWWNNRDRPKAPKYKDIEYHWLSTTPSWWNHLHHTKPQRAKATVWEHEVVKTSVDDLEDVDPPNVSNKPHKYYY